MPLSPWPPPPLPVHSFTLFALVRKLFPFINPSMPPQPMDSNPPQLPLDSARPGPRAAVAQVDGGRRAGLIAGLPRGHDAAPPVGPPAGGDSSGPTEGLQVGQAYANAEATLMAANDAAEDAEAAARRANDDVAEAQAGTRRTRARGPARLHSPPARLHCCPSSSSHPNTARQDAANEAAMAADRAESEERRAARDLCQADAAAVEADEVREMRAVAKSRRSSAHPSSLTLSPP